MVFGAQEEHAYRVDLWSSSFSPSLLCESPDLTPGSVTVPTLSSVAVVAALAR